MKSHYTNEMLENFQKTVKTLIKDEPNVRILLAISGGIDSMVMLDLFLKTQIQIGIAHCNFNLRGNESDEDENFIKQKAIKNNIDYYTNSFNTKEYAEKNGISIQMAARNLRYEWFYQLMRTYGYQKVSLAHNLDDKVETFFINLIRGTGLKGITGMKMSKKELIRPLLKSTRKEIREYATTNHIEYREDSSNKTTKYLRNKIRHDVIPELTTCEPNFLSIMNDNMFRFEKAWNVYHQWVQKKSEEMVVKEGNITKIRIDKLKVSSDLQTLSFEMLAPFNFSQTTIKNIIEGLDHQSGLKFFSPTHRCLKDREYLIISKRTNPINKKYYIENDDVEIFLPVHLQFKKIFDSTGYHIDKAKSMAQLDYNLLDFPLIIRKWQNGDYFQPLGMSGYKKVSDFFTDNKFSIYDKENTWILTSGEKIVWIVGHRIDNRFKIKENTTNIYIIKCMNEHQ